MLLSPSGMLMLALVWLVPADEANAIMFAKFRPGRSSAYLHSASLSVPTTSLKEYFGETPKGGSSIPILSAGTALRMNDDEFSMLLPAKSVAFILISLLPSGRLIVDL